MVQQYIYGCVKNAGLDPGKRKYSRKKCIFTAGLKRYVPGRMTGEIENHPILPWGKWVIFSV